MILSLREAIADIRCQLMISTDSTFLKLKVVIGSNYHQRLSMWEIQEKVCETIIIEIEIYYW